MLREVPQVLGHLGRTGRAVHADHVGLHRFERGERGADLGADEHAARRLDGHLHHERKQHARRAHRGARAVDRGLRLEEVVDGLDEQHVDAARDEPFDLELVAVAELDVGNLTERRQPRARAHRADHEPRPVGRRAARRDLARELGRAPVHLERLVGEVVLLEHEREGAERRGLDRVDPDREELLVHLRDEVGAGEHELLVAAVEGLAAEVVGAEVLALHPGAERSVEHQHSFGERIEERVLRAAPDGAVGAARVSHRTRLRGAERVSLPMTIALHARGLRRLRDMAPKIELVAAAPDKVRADLLAVPVFSGPQLGPGADVVDRALGGTLLAFAAEAGFEAKRGEVLAVPTGGQLGAKAAVLVGHGRSGHARRRRDAPGRCRAGAAVVEGREGRDHAARRRARHARSRRRGAGVRRRRRARCLPVPHLQVRRASLPKLARVQVLGRANAKVRDGLARGVRIAQAVTWARDLVNEPAEAKSPETVVKLARALARANGVTVRVWSGEQLARERLGGVIGVGVGSDRPPRFLRLAYEPRGAKATLALVGKGVVFDSGGLSIKTAGGMETMKTDMSGAAAVIAAMSALRDLDVKTRVIGFVPLVENMPSGNAMRPGDVLRMRNGKTVEVLNTDAEGRLILADALSLASEEKPDAIVDIATLTGAVTVALGDKIAGLMGTDDAWNAQVRAAADRVGERTWPLPLPDDYRKLLDSEVADLRNIGTARGRRHADRRAVPPRVRHRRPVGAPRRRRYRPRLRRRRLQLAWRHRLRRPHVHRAGEHVQEAEGRRPLSGGASPS